MKIIPAVTNDGFILSMRRLVFLCSLSLPVATAFSAPIGGQVAGGSGGINQSGLQTTIQQNSSALALDWQSFNIKNNEAVQFIQPNKNAIALNRILGNSASQIFGKLDANGQVILVNPNGLFFGDSAVINVGGLLASGLDISPTDFLNGDYVFSALAGSEGAVINHGIIQAATGGSVSLLGRQVKNAGFISAHLGAVNLVAAKEAVLSFDNDGLMGVKINKAILQDELGVNPALLNAGSIQAEGGRVLLSASVSQDVFSQAVNNGGLQTANSVVMHEDGSFTLGAGANVVNSGSIDVSASLGKEASGQVVVLGENINHSGSIQADAINTQAGSVELQANDTLLLTEKSTTSARAELGGFGGDIKLLGTNVGLFDETSVDASGANGGGSVFIGGDREGQNAQIPNSEFIFIGQQSNVYADALFNGNGGRIITFAEDTARIYGNLFARGGEESGNGGFIETSGLKGFEILSSPDISASVGEGGLWLIDPYNIDIILGGSDTGIIEVTAKAPYTYHVESGEIDATLGVRLIKNALNKNGHVLIKTNQLGDQGDGGNITFAVDLDYNGIDSGTLTLDSAGDIVLGNGWKIHDGTPLASPDQLNINLIANGDVLIGSGSSITTQGGYFKVGNESAIPTKFTNLGTIDTSGINGKVQGLGVLKGTDGGAITINSKGSLTTGTLISTGGEAINQAGLAAGDITLDAGSNINVNGSISANGSAGEEGRWAHYNGGNAGNIRINTTNITLNADLAAKGGGPSGGSAIPGNGGSITFTGPVTLANHVVLDASGNTNGDITFNNQIIASGHRGQNLTLTGKEITFLENIAAVGTSLGDLNITTSGNVNATNSHVFAKSLIVDSGRDITVGSINTNATEAGAIQIGFKGDFTSDGIINAKSTLVLGLGTDGDITISGDGEDNIFTFGGAVSGKTISIQGDAGKDTFNLYGHVKGSDSAAVNGNAGDDTYNILAAGIAADLDGGTGADTLAGADENNQWDNIGDASGALYQTGTSTSQIIFSNIEALVGGSDIDAFVLSTAAEINRIDGGGGENSLTAADQRNTWNITAKNAGVIENVATFSNIQSLTGGKNADVFNINAEISGSINGGEGADEFNLNALVSASVLGGAGEDIFRINNSDLMLLLDGEGGSDSLIVNHGAENTWGITKLNGGALVNADISQQVEFSNMENLHGGSGKDTFNLNANVSGEVLGLSGADEFNIKQENLSLLLNGGDGSDSLTGLDLQNTWIIDSNSAGTFTSRNATNTVSFSEIENINGGSDVDTFNLNADIGGTVTGNDGADIFNLNAGQTGTLYGNAGDDTFTILTAYVEADINGGADNDLLVARNVNNQWDILGEESGELYRQNQNEKVLFASVESLQGGEADDNFTLGDNGSITQINGGTGINSLTGRDEANTWNINAKNGGAVNYVGSFSGIHNLIGGSEADNFRLGASGEISNINGRDGDNRLTARDGVANTWTIASANAGSVSNIGGFSKIQTIVGGDGVDGISFEVGGYIDSLIDGGGGVDSLDISKLTSNISILLTKELSSTPNTLNVVSVETIQANTNKTNTLVGANAANTWTISGANNGNVAPTNNAEIDNTTSFFGFAHILGGDLDDIFVMTSAGKITGTIDGGDQQSFDEVDYSQQSNVTVDLGLVLNAEKFRGNNQNITLVGSSNENTWEITGLNSGTLTEGGNTIYFEDFNFLKGGTDTDTFNVADGGSIGTLINGEMVGEINGADGDDTLNVTLTGSEQGQINFIGGGHNMGNRINISGGSGSYTTTYSINNNDHAQLDYLNNDNGNTFTLSYQSSEQINDTLVARSLLIAGGANDDAISLATNSFSVNNLAAVSYANKNELIVNGGGGSDSIDVAGAIDMAGRNVVLSAETLSNTSDGLINASNLYLEAIDTAGSDTARIDTNIENLHIINSSNVYIDEVNGINIAELDQADNIYVFADSVTDRAALVNDGTLSLNARSGDIVLDADNRLSGLLNLSAFGHIDINNLTSTELGSVTANHLTVHSAGDIFGQGAVNVRQNTLFQSPGADINLRGANDFSRLEIISANSASVNDVNTLLLENSQTDVAINIAANGLEANNVSAGALVNLNAGSGDFSGSGLVAPRIELRATTGIGKEQAPVTTRTDTLFAENGTNQINIDNIGVVTLERLKNTGDITFNNDADIYVKPGSVDAGFNTGTLVLKTETGSFLGLGEANPNNPDITAYAGIFFGLQGTFGTIKRPLVLNVQESVLINSRSSLNPIFYPNQPRTVDDRSLLQFNAFDALSTLSGGQLVEVETLAEINPAIFTDVRNYASAEIAIRLPRDQLYADELEEYEE